MPLSVHVEAELKIGLLGGNLVLAGFVFRSKNEQGNQVLEDISKGEIKGLPLSVVSGVRPVLKRSVERDVEIKVKKEGRGKRAKETKVVQRVEYQIIVASFVESPPS